MFVAWLQILEVVLGLFWEFWGLGMCSHEGIPAWITPAELPWE